MAKEKKTNSEMTEFEQLNTRTNERNARRVKEEEHMAFVKVKKAKDRRKAYSNKSAGSIAALLMLSGAVTVAGMAEMIHPTIWVTTSIISLCAACVRFGVWFGRVAR